RMETAIKIREILAAVAEHRPGKSGERFFRNLDGAGREELVVRNHGENVQRPTSNVQRPTRTDALLHVYVSILMKEMSPLRSMRARRTFDKSSTWASRRRSSSRSC